MAYPRRPRSMLAALVALVALFTGVSAEGAAQAVGSRAGAAGISSAESGRFAAYAKPKRKATKKKATRKKASRKKAASKRGAPASTAKPASGSGASTAAIPPAPAPPPPPPAPSFPETVMVDAKRPLGFFTRAAMIEGRAYRIVVSGTYAYGLGSGGKADAECSAVEERTVWTPITFQALEVQGDPLDLYLNGEPITWRPTNGDLTGCNGDNHTYEYLMTAPSSGPVHLAVHEPTARDNRGFLLVTIID